DSHLSNPLEEMNGQESNSSRRTANRPTLRPSPRGRDAEGAPLVGSRFLSAKCRRLPQSRVGNGYPGEQLAPSSGRLLGNGRIVREQRCTQRTVIPGSWL